MNHSSDNEITVQTMNHSSDNCPGQGDTRGEEDVCVLNDLLPQHLNY